MCGVCVVCVFGCVYMCVCIHVRTVVCCPNQILNVKCKYSTVFSVVDAGSTDHTVGSRVLV